ncbi:hypothetical protein SLS56_000401 [Neofusicoccum ribis]|uniref:Rhodopsin domain-containing protein n=1 Tax=Neofusicoccum ribis TaxID=45134 RepID=A0ABR3TF00_9PEZI
MSSLPVESYHLNDSQKHLRVTLITCLTVAVAFVLLRVLVRLRIQRQFNTDDYLLLLAVYLVFAKTSQVEKMWTPTMDKGHCADTDGITTGTYVYSAINVALTWYYALALVPLIWKLQLKTAVKLSSIFVLGVGILASIATIIRFKYLLDFSTTSNPLNRAAKNAPRDNDASEPPRKLRRGYTFQLSEIDSMDLKQDETPIIRCQSYEAPSSISVTTPGTLNEDRRVSYFAKEISMEAGEKDLERGV